MDRYTNHHVPSVSGREAALSPEANSASRPPALGDHWLAQLTATEVEDLLDRRSPLLYRMLSASTDTETQSVVHALDVASSFLDDLESPSREVWMEQRNVLQCFLEEFIAEAAWRISRAQIVEVRHAPIVAPSSRESDLTTPEAADCGPSELVPSIDDLKMLACRLRECHGDRWEFFLQLMTVCGLRFGETLALRFDSFQRGADGSWVVRIANTLHDVGSGPGQLSMNMELRSVPLPPALASRMVGLFGELMGEASAFMFAAHGRQEPMPRVVRRMLGSAMNRLGWSEDLFWRPARALRMAWRVHGVSLEESFFPRDEDGTGADPSKD